MFDWFSGALEKFVFPDGIAVNDRSKGYVLFIILGKFFDSVNIDRSFLVEKPLDSASTFSRSIVSEWLF